MTAPIFPTQAWCKLAVLIADGLPAPKEIRISDRVVSITLDDLTGFDRWMKHFNARLDQPFRNAGRTLHEALTDWEGYLLDLKAHVPFAAPDTKSTTEDMSRVREIAEAEPSNQCTGCGKTGRIAAHRPGCSVAAAFDAQLARAVSGE